MVILKKIATPFVAIWRWIKETAWVQPLLIVGVIFAIIFSIPSITSWVQSWDFGDDTYTWLENKQLSLKGCTDEKLEGEAAKFFTDFADAQEKWGNGEEEESRKIMEKYVGSSNKMFLYFVKENDASANINEANKLLVDDLWKEKVVNGANELYKNDENKEEKVKIATASFKYQTIFVDQKIDVDSTDHTYDDHTAFDYLMTSKSQDIFSTVDASFANSPYYQNIVNKKIDAISLEDYKSKVEDLMDASSYSNSIPALLTIDLSPLNKTKSIVTNTVFTFEGSTKYERATFLANAWIGAEQFAL